MVEINGRYAGQLRCESEHAPSGSKLATDAPRDNEGRGETFSPTDLVATAVATCMLTIMGIYARRHELDIDGASYRVEKHMSTEPRRIGRLLIEITLPAVDDERHRRGLETSAMACPVKRSLHPEIELDISLSFGEQS